MSGKLVGEVLECAPADLTPAEMLVLIALAESARDTDRLARYHTSAARIADRTRLSPGTVRNALSQLARRGMIARQKEAVTKGVVQTYKLAELAEHHRIVTARQEAPA